jgi:signal transduction histidine kinase
MWRELGEFATVQIIALPLGVLLAAFGGYALARKALAPIDAMTRETQKISAEDLGARLSIKNPEDELGRLTVVLNAMLARLQGAFEQLRRFTADASHELRTPLTAIRSVGEVALQDQKNPVEYRDVIGSMLEEVDRLTRLVESLLVLSRADASHTQLRRMDTSLVSVAKEASSMLEVLAEEKRQEIYVEGDRNLLISITRWAVEAHGGGITLKSEEGHDTTFRISLPLTSASSSSRAQGGPNEKDIRNSSRGCHGLRTHLGLS